MTAWGDLPTFLDEGVAKAGVSPPLTSVPAGAALAAGIHGFCWQVPHTPGNASVC